MSPWSTIHLQNLLSADLDVGEEATLALRQGTEFLLPVDLVDDGVVACEQGGAFLANDIVVDDGEGHLEIWMVAIADGVVASPVAGPAERDQVLRVVGTARDPRNDVVDLEGRPHCHLARDLVGEVGPLRVGREALRLEERPPQPGLLDATVLAGVSVSPQHPIADVVPCVDVAPRRGLLGALGERRRQLLTQLAPQGLVECAPALGALRPVEPATMIALDPGLAVAVDAATATRTVRPPPTLLELHGRPALGALEAHHPGVLGLLKEAPRAGLVLADVARRSAIGIPAPNEEQRVGLALPGLDPVVNQCGVVAAPALREVRGGFHSSPSLLTLFYEMIISY